MLSSGGAAWKLEPGCRGDVSDAADHDGAGEGAGGGGWGLFVREDESGDAAYGGGQGVSALCGEGRGGVRGGQAAVGGAQGGFGGKVEDRGFARCRHLRVARVIGEVCGGPSEGFHLGEDGAFRGDSGDDLEGGGAAGAHAGDAPSRGGEFAAVRGRAGAGRGPWAPFYEERGGEFDGDRGRAVDLLRPRLKLLRADARPVQERRHRGAKDHGGGQHRGRQEDGRAQARGRFLTQDRGGQVRLGREPRPRLHRGEPRDEAFHRCPQAPRRSCDRPCRGVPGGGRRDGRKTGRYPALPYSGDRVREPAVDRPVYLREPTRGWSTRAGIRRGPQPGKLAALDGQHATMALTRLNRGARFRPLSSPSCWRCRR